MIVFIAASYADETGAKVATFTGHDTSIACVTFSADGALALSGGYDRKVCLYDIAKRQRVRSFEGHTATVRAPIYP